MRTKLFIVLFATALGAIITVGCNHHPEGETSGDNQPVIVVTNPASTNSMGSINTPSVTGTNNVSATNNP